MFVTLTVEAQVEFISGKFASRDEIEDAVLEAVESCNPDSLGLDESEYEVTDWNVTVDTPDEKLTKAAKIAKVMDAVFMLTGKQERQKAEQLITILEAKGVRV